MLENRLVNSTLNTCEIHLRSVLLIEVHKNESRPQTEINGTIGFLTLIPPKL